MKDCTLMTADTQYGTSCMAGMSVEGPIALLVTSLSSDVQQLGGDETYNYAIFIVTLRQRAILHHNTTPE